MTSRSLWHVQREPFPSGVCKSVRLSARPLRPRSRSCERVEHKGLREDEAQALKQHTDRAAIVLGRKAVLGVD